MTDYYNYLDNNPLECLIEYELPNLTYNQIDISSDMVRRYQHGFRTPLQRFHEMVGNDDLGFPKPEFNLALSTVIASAVGAEDLHPIERGTAALLAFHNRHEIVGEIEEKQGIDLVAPKKKMEFYNPVDHAHMPQKKSSTKTEPTKKPEKEGKIVHLSTHTPEYSKNILLEIEYKSKYAKGKAALSQAETTQYLIDADIKHFKRYIPFFELEYKMIKIHNLLSDISCNEKELTEEDVDFVNGFQVSCSQMVEKLYRESKNISGLIEEIVQSKDIEEGYYPHQPPLDNQLTEIHALQEKFESYLKNLDNIWQKNKPSKASRITKESYELNRQRAQAFQDLLNEWQLALSKAEATKHLINTGISQSTQYVSFHELGSQVYDARNIISNIENNIVDISAHANTIKALFDRCQQELTSLASKIKINHDLLETQEQNPIPNHEELENELADLQFQYDKTLEWLSYLEEHSSLWK